MESKEQQCRWVRRFDWSAVSPTLTRQLLISVYKSNRDYDEAAKIPALSDKGLAGQAKKVFNASLKRSSHFDAAIEVLVRHWIPNAASVVIGALGTRIQVTLIGNDRKLVFSTKPQRVAFIKRCERTTNFKTNVFRAFKETHRIPKWERRPPGFSSIRL